MTLLSAAIYYVYCEVIYEGCSGMRSSSSGSRRKPQQLIVGWLVSTCCYDRRRSRRRQSREREREKKTEERERECRRNHHKKRFEVIYRKRSGKCAETNGGLSEGLNTVLRFQAKCYSVCEIAGNTARETSTRRVRFAGFARPLTTCPYPHNTSTPLPPLLTPATVARSSTSPLL